MSVAASSSGLGFPTDLIPVTLAEPTAWRRDPWPLRSWAGRRDKRFPLVPGRPCGSWGPWKGLPR